MNIGTKSLLYGAHAFWLHPLFVATAWWKLYGWGQVKYSCPVGTLKTSLRDWRLWWAFIIHDWGYWGSPDMDGPHGEEHPLWAARVFDNSLLLSSRESRKWFFFMAAHSRGLIKTMWWLGSPSPLAAADKLSLVLEPVWFYIFRIRLTGEIREYQSTPRHVTEHGFVGCDLELRRRTWKEDMEWWMEVRTHLRQWAVANRAVSTSTSASPSSTTSR